MPLMYLLLAGCVGEASDTTTPAAAFDAPWEGLEATGEVTAAFEAEIGEDHAGPGWFHTEDDAVWGAEGAWARTSRPEGASQDVVTVSVGGRTASGVVALQLVVAASAWREGGIPLDGESATGAILREGAAIAYVVGGTLEIEEAGTGDGGDVEGTLTDAELAEVSG